MQLLQRLGNRERLKYKFSVNIWIEIHFTGDLFSNVRFKYAISCNIFFYCLSNIVLVLFREKSCRFLKHFPFIAIFAIISFCSPSELRKKANTLFGIQFDDAKYSKLGKLLETISEKRELVSSFSDLLNLLLFWLLFLYICMKLNNIYVQSDEIFKHVLSSELFLALTEKFQLWRFEQNKDLNNAWI